ncbi:MAG TPA: cbb3-type cytochrome c oxidase subunit I [Planctomycetia bacterium]|nr:cbb3-type cytochrome c oxidase subunit I [Planctomycetia bacterium]
MVWQHLFWFYSHPAVYIMVLPAMGIVSEVLATFSRKPIFGYRPMVFSMIAIAALGFIVWGHHMFTSGMSPTAATGFQLATLFIALPSAIKVFNWLATLFGGRIQFTTPMLHAIAFVCVFILGGLSGIWMAVTPADIPIHDTYVVVAHFHFILAGSSLFGIFAGVTFWFPKMFGRMLNEPLGKLHFALSFLFLNGIFLTMHQAGFAGMVRRVPDPYFGGRLEQIQTLNQWMTYAAIGMGATQLLLVLNLFGSLLFGRRSEANPWKATTLEWSVSSPPPYYNYRTIPTVTCGPHEYSAPDRDDDFTPQAAPAPLSEATA